nr:MAG TPA: hypothetical protein [Caudoviricetes sp.]
MDKEKLLKAGILTALAAGVGYFAYRFVKETKRQIKEMEEANAAQTQELLDTIKLRDEQLALAEEHIDALVYGTPEETPDVNEELEEMRRSRTRIHSTTLEEGDIAPTDEDDYHVGATQTAEDVEHHNVWKENEYFQTGEQNIPYFVIESAKELKGNEGQSMRHDTDPNSVEAWNQYKAVMISELYDDTPTAKAVSERYGMGLLLSKTNIVSIIDVFSELLEVNDTKIVQPYNAFDNNVWEDVYDRRIDFFGPDTYYASLQFPVTFGEILYEYATKFVDDTEDGALLPMVAYMLYESGLLDAETIEQKLLIISKILEHRNVREIGNGMKKLSMFGRVVDRLDPEDTGHDVRLYTEYNEFIGRASTFEEEYMANMEDDYDDE